MGPVGNLGKTAMPSELVDTFFVETNLPSPLVHETEIRPGFPEKSANLILTFDSIVRVIRKDLVMLSAGSHS
jgi:hypothetical protein